MNQSPATAGTGASGVGHDSVPRAVLTAIMDLFSREGRIDPLPDDCRLDGQTALVTGANTGLGKAVATDLARRGATVIMACRSGIPDAGADVRHQSGSNRVTMEHVDLASIESIRDLCRRLADSGTRLDTLVLNAGLMPRTARRSAQGFEVMFAVHYLANRLLVENLTESGVVDISVGTSRRPRVIFVSSEAHKSSAPIDFANFGAFHDYGLTDGMKWYAHSKLHMSTYATELARRFAADPDSDCGVYHLCPGPINSSIARETPIWLKPILIPLMALFFRSPEKAAEPVIWLAGHPDLDAETGVYLHMMRRKDPSPLATDPENGQQLWTVGADQLSRLTST